MKGLKRIVNAIMSAELQNIDNKEYAEDIDDYLIIEKNTGVYWGHMPKSKLDYMKNKVEKIST